MSDDNKVKLLRIQHALLEVLVQRKKEASTEMQLRQIENELVICLAKYKQLVTEIESGIYHDLKEKIIHLPEHSYNLEEELVELEEIETFYNQLVEVQSRFMQTFAGYSKEPLVLSDMSKLNINGYLKRKEAIKAYLVNKNNIVENRKQLDKISEQLIAEEQKSARIEKKFMFLDEELVRRLFSSEGRLLIQEKRQEVLKYTSIVDEYSRIGILLDKNGYSGKTLEEVELVAIETRDKLKAATISYDVLPDIEKKKILDEISLESVEANYQLVLVKILEEIYKQSENLEAAIRKREKINDLLQYRKAYLEKLKIKHGVDPFKRLHVSEQLNELLQYESNSRTVLKLRRELASLNASIENLEVENATNSKVLEEGILFIDDVIDNHDHEPSFNDLTVNVVPSEIHVLANQVVDVKDVSENFNYKKCREKTRGVIKRVHQILSGMINQQPRNMTPEIVIEHKKDEIENVIEKQPDVLVSIKPVSNVNLETTVNPDLEVSAVEQKIELPEVNTIESNVSGLPVIDGDLFADIDPFEKPVLFAEKIEEPEDVIPEVPIELPINNPVVMPNVVFPEIGSNVEVANVKTEVDNKNNFDNGFDFWSTDVNINNLTDASFNR